MNTITEVDLKNKVREGTYVGRLAPSPSGYLHVGHAQTFYIAMKRAMEHSDYKLILRMEDLDVLRCKPTYLHDIMKDLNWFGIYWTHGPQLKDVTIGKEYFQSERKDKYVEYWNRLLKSGHIYPCKHSRRDVERALSAPHEGDSEIIYPPTLRPDYMQNYMVYNDTNIISKAFYEENRTMTHIPDEFRDLNQPTLSNWRFRVPDNLVIQFTDSRCGERRYRAGIDFGDFIIWRSDGFPSYDFACVVDDLDMNITEVVRGEDLLLSTARQLLLYYALGVDRIPEFYHCPLLRDESGKRLAKRDDARSLKVLREDGYSPARIIQEYFTL